jgi:hypothetical protein
VSANSYFHRIASCKYCLDIRLQFRGRVKTVCGRVLLKLRREVESIDCKMTAAEAGYNFSFIAGGLLVNEMAAVAAVHLDAPDWDYVAAQAENANLLQARTASSHRRMFAEVRNRLQALTLEEEALLVEGSSGDQTAVAWLAVCKAYRLVREFAEEVVRERFVTLALTVEGHDFERFLESKMIWDEQLEALTDSTLKKGRTVVMRMLREAGIISEAGFIQPTLLSPELIQVLRADDPSLYRIFPLSDQDFARALA